MFGYLTGSELRFFASIIGLVATLCLGPAVIYFRDKASADVESVHAPWGIHPYVWDKVIEVPEAGGKWLGLLERVMFFCAFWLGKPELIGGWLIFKAAAKWEMWTNIVKVPDKIDGVDEVDFLRARHKWGSRVM